MTEHEKLETIVELKNISKTFQLGKEKVSALKKVSLSLLKGEQAAITGKSGAGKSTLLHIIGTLDRPSSGSIKLAGKNLVDLSDQELSHFRNKEIGFVFQMNNLLAEFSALENIMMPGIISGASLPELTEKARELLKAVGLPHRESHRPGELSGGEQQRIAVARALTMSPSILLADEPTGNLDKSTSETIEDLLFNLCNRYKITMLLVTHDERLAERFPKRIIMEDGHII